MNRSQDMSTGCSEREDRKTTSGDERALPPDRKLLPSFYFDHEVLHRHMIIPGDHLFRGFIFLCVHSMLRFGSVAIDLST